MSRPLIGISCGTSALDQRAQTEQDRLNRAYSYALALAGATPVLLPNIVEPNQGNAILDRLNGLLLSGGYDVDPALYGESTLNDTVEVDSTRDHYELPLIRLAFTQDVPLFAICRGIQALNVALGGSLYQDIPAQMPAAGAHRQTAPRHEATHSIAVASGSRLAAIVGADEIDVNSFHHQALKGVATELEVVARASDGVVEAVESRSRRFCVGVQFHPEEMVADADGPARRLFSAFARAAC